MCASAVSGKEVFWLTCPEMYSIKNRKINLQSKGVKVHRETKLGKIDGSTKQQQKGHYTLGFQISIIYKVFKKCYVKSRAMNVCAPQ